MKKLLMGLALLPLAAGAAKAAGPLTDLQMDGITAGFLATAVADAQAQAGHNQIVFTATAALGQRIEFATCCSGSETTITAYKVISGAQAASIVTSVATVALPTPNP